ncbi:MAG: LapA family protein [Crocosphaera sp.]|nr:LapA family protein [Crocosphaera sp.]
MIVATVKNIIISILLAFWLGAIAIFSIQNIRMVSLKFLLWDSIELPIGVLLSFCVGGGLIIGSFFPLFLKRTQKKRLRTPKST